MCLNTDTSAASPTQAGFLLPPFDVIFVWLPLVVVHVPYYTLVGPYNVSLFLRLVSQLELVLYICSPLVRCLPTLPAVMASLPAIEHQN
jgi:hypothetical protein